MRAPLRLIAVGIALGPALAGCAELMPATHDALADATRACVAQNKQFVDAWGCVQSRDALGQFDEAGDRRKILLRLGDDLASQVSAKTLTSAEAKKRLVSDLPGGLS